MIIPEDRLRQMYEYYKQHGLENTAIKENLPISTIERYLRDAKKLTTKIPKVLLLDIETLPMHVRVWSLFGNKYIDYNNIIKDWLILSWSAKWLFEPEMYGEILTPRQAKQRTDKSILKNMWKMLNDADVIIAHNGDRFDIKRLNTRFLLNGMEPPNPYRSIDTLKVAKGLSFSSNRLDYLGQIMVNRQKLDTNMRLWVGCENGKQSDLDKMLEYNKNDVFLLEEVYLQLRPWIKSHPNIGIYMESDTSVCHRCGSEKIIWKGYYSTPANEYASCQCQDCGGWGRARKSLLTKEQKRALTMSIAR